MFPQWKILLFSRYDWKTINSASPHRLTLIQSPLLNVHKTRAGSPRRWDTCRMDGVPQLYEQWTRGATCLGGPRSLTAGAAQLILLKNGLLKEKECEILSEWNLTGCVNSSGAGSTKSRQKGASLICCFVYLPAVNAGILRANVEQFVQQLWPTWDECVHVCLYEGECCY